MFDIYMNDLDISWERHSYLLLVPNICKGSYYMGMVNNTNYHIGALIPSKNKYSKCSDEYLRGPIIKECLVAIETQGGRYIPRFRDRLVTYLLLELSLIEEESNV